MRKITKSEQTKKKTTNVNGGLIYLTFIPVVRVIKGPLAVFFMLQTHICHKISVCFAYLCAILRHATLKA